MINYKIGDKVKIREDLIVNEWYGGSIFNELMEEYRGMICYITYVDIGYGYITYFLDKGGYWHYTHEMLEPVEK